MERYEESLWMPIAAVLGFVLFLLLWQPVKIRYDEWKLRRAFRLRDKADKRVK